MYKFIVYVEAKPQGKTGGISSHINVEAESESMAKEMAKQKFIRGYPAWKDYEISISNVKRL